MSKHCHAVRISSGHKIKKAGATKVPAKLFYMGYEDNNWWQTLFSVSSFSLFIKAGGGAKMSFQAPTKPPYQGRPAGELYCQVRRKPLTAPAGFAISFTNPFSQSCEYQCG